MSNVENLLINNGYEGTVFFSNDEYADAIVGITHNGRLIYDHEMMIEWLMKHDQCSYEEAVEWIDYNTIRSLDYVENGPIIQFKLYD